MPETVWILQAGLIVLPQSEKLMKPKQLGCKGKPMLEFISKKVVFNQNIIWKGLI